MNGLMIVVGVVAAVVLLLAVLVKLYFCYTGLENIVAKVDSHSAYTVDELTETSMTVSTVVEFVNLGKQCAVVMDCFVRPQLPYEQYDGVEMRGHAELLSAPREDDYFEAHLIERFKTLNIVIRIRLKARKNMDLRTALSHMVDVPVDIIYTELGRSPWKVSKTRIVLTAEEIAKVAGVELVEE